MTENKNKRAFFIDIDGTLLSQHNREISEHSKEIFREARKRGTYFFINTARPAFLVPESLFPRDIFDGVCSGCGTRIEFHGTIIYEHFIPEDILVTLSGTLIRGLEYGTVCFEGFDTIYYYGEESPWIKESGFKRLASAEDFLTKYKGAGIQKFCTTGKTKIAEVSLGECERYFNMMYHPNYTEGAPYGYDKGTAIKLAEEHLGLDHALTVAVGDSVNDLEALTYAGTSVAMGNSEDRIKELCDFVTLPAWEDGVADAVAKLTLL